MSQRSLSGLAARSSIAGRQSDRGSDGEESQRALPDSSNPQEPPSGPIDGPSRDSPGASRGQRGGVASTSSNVVPKDSVVRAAITMAAAAGAISADEVKMDAPQQGQWVTASFDELPDR